MRNLQSQARSGISLEGISDNPFSQIADPPLRPYAHRSIRPSRRHAPLVLHHRVDGYVGWKLSASMEKFQFDDKKC
jgi:hypothetical protein